MSERRFPNDSKKYQIIQTSMTDHLHLDKLQYHLHKLLFDESSLLFLCGVCRIWNVFFFSYFDFFHEAKPSVTCQLI